MREARVGLVTPLRDGMNLVAKEYIAAQDPQDPGVLVLSRFAGAAEQLDSALLVNPYDADEMADALDPALTMSLAERQARWREAGTRSRTPPRSAGAAPSSPPCCARPPAARCTCSAPSRLRRCPPDATPAIDAADVVDVRNGERFHSGGQLTPASGPPRMEQRLPGDAVVADRLLPFCRQQPVREALGRLAPSGRCSAGLGTITL